MKFSRGDLVENGWFQTVKLVNVGGFSDFLMRRCWWLDEKFGGRPFTNGWFQRTTYFDGGDLGTTYVLGTTYFDGGDLEENGHFLSGKRLALNHFSSSIVFDDNNDDFLIRSGEKSKFCPWAGEELGYACSGPAGRARWGPGIGHGRELFPYGTSSHTHGYTIDFINPDWHLLGKTVLCNTLQNMGEILSFC